MITIATEVYLDASTITVSPEQELMMNIDSMSLQHEDGGCAEDGGYADDGGCAAEGSCAGGCAEDGSCAGGCAGPSSDNENEEAYDRLIDCDQKCNITGVNILEDGIVQLAVLNDMNSEIICKVISGDIHLFLANDISFPYQCNVRMLYRLTKNKYVMFIDL